MVANQQNANPNSITEDIQSMSKLMEQSIDAIGDLSIGSLYSTAAGKTGAGKFLRERANILRGLVNEVDRPILKSFANDMITTMASWFEDPEVLCCLINALWLAHNENSDLKSNQEYTLADTKFGEFLDKLIALLDLIIAFLTQDLKKLVTFIPDFIKEIFSSLMGAILLVLQETLYTIRNSVLQTIFDWIDDSLLGQALWAKCLPMQNFLDIIKKHINDYGLFAELMEKIRGFVSGRKSTFKQLSMQLVPNVKDLEFLYWMRDLLIKLKHAVVNFELCVEYAYIPDNNYVGPGIGSSNADNTVDQTSIFDMDANANLDVTGSPVVPLMVGDDGKTIILSSNDARLRNDEFKANGSYITRLSSDSISNFIKNNYNFSGDVVEQSLKRVSDGCPGFPGGQNLKEYFNRIRNRNLT